MTYALMAVGVLALLAWDVHAWRHGRKRCPECGEHDVTRVLSTGLPGWFCHSCTAAGGFVFTLDWLVSDYESGVAGPFFDGWLLPFTHWWSGLRAFWCWATHDHG